MKKLIRKFAHYLLKTTTPKQIFTNKRDLLKITKWEDRPKLSVTIINQPHQSH